MSLLFWKNYERGEIHSGAPRKTLRPWRYYSMLGLRTALWTAIAAACFVYAAKEGAFARQKPNPVVRVCEPAGPPTALPMAEFPSDAPPRADSFAMVKAPRRGSRATYPGTEKTAAAPRLTSAEPGRWFVKINFHQDSGKKEETRLAPEEGVVLTGKSLQKKIRVRGARPVTAAAAKRYSVNREAERLRVERLEKLEELEAARKRLFYGRLKISAAIFVALAALLVAAARIISAWRSIHKPDGPHWTFK